MTKADVRVSLAQLQAVASLADLPLTDERLAALAPQVEMVIQGIAALDQLDLAEVEPEIVFRARWEGDDGR